MNISSEDTEENELYPFLFDQFHCGKNERMNYRYNNAARSKLVNVRVANGTDTKVEQAPYMARLRYISRNVIPLKIHRFGVEILNYRNLRIPAKEYIFVDGKVFTNVGQL